METMKDYTTKIMKEIIQYEKACEAIKDKFIKKYFKDAYNDWFWVGEKIGGVFYINNYYFNIDFMITALKYKATIDQIFDYYNAEVDYGLREDQGQKFNFKNYLKYPNNFILDFQEGVGYKFIVR